MRGIKHPMTGEVYEVGENGTVVVSGPDGSGVFTLDGRWLSGELKVADAHLCGWLASERGENRFRGADQ